MVPHATDDYDFTFDNRVGGTEISHEEDTPYKVSEHILWAPRKLRVASIGAGPSGLMMCYKKEKEFGDSIDLVVYERELEVTIQSDRLYANIYDRPDRRWRSLAHEPLPGMSLRRAIRRIPVLICA
jgi:hypothetical protein